MDQHAIVKTFREKGILTIKEGNGVMLTLLKMEAWKPELGKDWIYLLFDLFQIRTVAEPFSEVSLDIVEFGTKPTIFHSPANKVLKNAPIEGGNIQFSLVREPNWNKLLFQFSQPVLVKIEPKSDVSPDFRTDLFFPLLGPNVKEMFLGPDGDIKLIKS